MNDVMALKLHYLWICTIHKHGFYCEVKGKYLVNMKKLLDILLVEDNPSDVYLIREILDECGILGNLQLAIDGIEALDFLNRQVLTEKCSNPDIILLDLNLPKKNGFDVLHEIKSSPLLQNIPTIILTTSKDEDDMQKAFDLKADYYVVKPIDIEQCRNLMKHLDIM